MKQTIEIPEGFELKKVSDTEYKIVKKEKVLPKTWEEFCELNPVKDTEQFIAANSGICDSVRRERDKDTDRNLIPSEEKAEAILALCQLIQLRDCYNDGWKPDWRDPFDKYVIYFIHFARNTFIKQTNTNCSRILAFKTAELRDQFFDNFKDLIEKLKPLYE